LGVLEAAAAFKGNEMVIEYFDPALFTAGSRPKIEQYRLRVSQGQRE
jgi:hypothetical protein